MELQKISASKNKQVEEIIPLRLEDKAFSDCLFDREALSDLKARHKALSDHNDHLPVPVIPYIGDNSFLEAIILETIAFSDRLSMLRDSIANQLIRVQMLNASVQSRAAKYWLECSVEMQMITLSSLAKIQEIIDDEAYNSPRSYSQRVGGSLFPLDSVVDTGGFTDTGNRNYNSSQAYSQTVGGSSFSPDAIAGIGGFTDTGNRNYNSSQAYSQTFGGSLFPPNLVVGIEGFTDTFNRNYNSSQAYSQTVGGSSSPPDVVMDIGGFPGIGNQNPIVETHRLNDDQFYKLVENTFGVSVAAVFASSSTFPKVANAAGSMACLTAMSLRHRGWKATRFLAKFGAIACAAGTLAAAGEYLPKEYRWVAGVAFLMPATAVAFA